MLDYIFILFSPGFGGNHLINLIAESFQFDKEKIIKDKQTAVQNYAENFRVHGDVSNMQDEILYAKLKQEKPIILCGHLGEYLKNKLYFNLIKNNKKFIVINSENYKTDVERLGYRLNKLGYSYHEHIWFCEEQHFCYKPENISHHLNVKKDDIISVLLPELFNSDITPLLLKLSKELNLPIIGDVEFCQAIHTRWLSNNKIGL